MKKRSAAIDVGLKRIGLAISLDQTSVLPQSPVLRRNRREAASKVDAFLRQWSIERLIVGVPMGSKSEQEMQRRIRHFIGLLDFDGEIVYVDESDTSVEAAERMKGSIRNRRDGKLDSIAAAIILERFLKQS